MDTQATRASRNESAKLVRTSVLVFEETDRALRELADEGERPLSWEIRRALEDHVARRRQGATA